MTHAKFVQKIARRYLEIYKTLGFVAAGEYGERVVGDNKELQEAVRAEVGKLMTGGTKDDKTPRPA